MQRAALAVAMAFVLALSTSASATSCSHEVVAQIRFAGRQVCWTYRGSATSFVGKFSSGQTVSAQMRGDAIDYDPRSGSAVAVSRPRDPNVEGPGGVLLRRSGRPGRFDLHRPQYGELSLQFLALRNVGDAGRGEDLRPMNLYRERLSAGTKAAPTAP